MFSSKKKRSINRVIIIPLCTLLCACSAAPQTAGYPGDNMTSDTASAEVVDTTENTDIPVGTESLKVTANPEETTQNDAVEESDSTTKTIESIDTEDEVNAVVKTSASGNAAGTAGNTAPLFNDKTVFMDVEDSKKLAALLNEIMAGGQLYPVKTQETPTSFSISAITETDRVLIQKVNIDGQDALRIGKSYYPYDERLDQYAPASVDNDDVISRLLNQSVKCNEPKDEMDYVIMAEKLVYAWLDTLKNEKGRYKLKKYTPEYTVINAMGFVGYGTEFCATVYFSTDIEDDDSAFYSEDGYDTFYHYYNGPMVYVRCHYENGRCDVVDYSDAFQADLTADLNGIAEGTGDYPTFWEFYDDTANLKNLMKKIPYSRSEGAAAASPIMLADGQIGYVEICPRDGITWKQGGKSYGVYDNYFSNTKTDTYSSPIDYKDGSGACAEQYDKSFDLIWDDYNGDGNPEYAIKQDSTDEDKKGARYEVRCMSNDMTPRSTRFDFYMAGRHEECIHLQMTEWGTVIWSLENGKMTPNHDIDKYRMYSRRYYLPGNMRGYTDEKKIKCFFWNNTAKKVSTGNRYHIEYFNGDKWVKVSKNRKIKNTKCPAYRDVTLTFDISGITRKPGEYRIVLGKGKKKVCGGFYIRGDRVSARILQDESSVTIINDGTASLRLYDLCWIKDGKPAGNIEYTDIGNSEVIAAGKTKVIPVTPSSTFDGKYSIRADVGITLETKPIEYKYTRYFGDAEVSERDGNLILTVDVKKDVTGDAQVEWFTGNDWERTQFENVPLDLKAGKQEIVFTDNTLEYMDSEEYNSFYQAFIEQLKAAKESGDLSETEQSEYEKFIKMSKEEFFYCLAGATPVETLVKAPLRISVAGEYIYINI